MSKTISYKGILAVGEQDRISLKTLNGKTGYKITKLSTISRSPGDGDIEHIVQVFSTDQTGAITAIVNFTNSDLLAVAYNKEQQNSTSPASQVIIFDNTKFNQNIFVTLTDSAGGTVPGNYYIELEAMSLNDVEATYMTLQNIRQITS